MFNIFIWLYINRDMVFFDNYYGLCLISNGFLGMYDLFIDE